MICLTFLSNQIRCLSQFNTLIKGCGAITGRKGIFTWIHTYNNITLYSILCGVSNDLTIILTSHNKEDIWKNQTEMLWLFRIEKWDAVADHSQLVKLLGRESSSSSKRDKNIIKHIRQWIIFIIFNYLYFKFKFYYY